MTILRRVWFFVTRWRRVADLDDEMRLHVEMRAAANRRRGLGPDDAAREARRRFGNRLKLREESRDMWGFSDLERAAGDLRYAVRQVIRRPAWTFVVVLTLALGIGANTSIFALVDAMLFKPAPWNKASRIVWIAALKGRSAGTRSMSYPDYVAYRDHAMTLSGVLAYGGNGMSIGGEQPQRVLGGLVSGNYFELLGIRAAMGRMFVPEEDSTPGAHPVAVLSDALWRSHFGADPRVIDSTVAIDGTPFTIIGVAPRGFTGIAYADDAEQLWVPLAMQHVVMPTEPGLLDASNAAWLRVAGRLRQGATVAEADSEMRVIARRLNPAGTPADREKSARVVPMRGGLTPWEQGDFAFMFGLVAIAPALVLLVACANVANVLMARNLSRRKEFAMRRAIGASRGQLIGQLLAEALVVALLSAATGFVVSFALTAVLVYYGDVPRDFSVLLTPDGRALVATAIGAIGTTVFFGLAPALTATKFEVLSALKDEGTTSTAARGSVRLRRVFVVAQVALSLTLLIAAGLFLQSLSKAMHVDPGFEARGLVTVSFDLDLQGYTAPRRDAFLAEFAERASRIPGVISTAITSSLPLGGDVYGATVVGQHALAPADATWVSISPRYFETLHAPLVRGREFTDGDTAQGLPVAIVNETLARRLWPDVDPIGQRLRVDNAKEPWRDVVGVARDAKYLFLTEPPRAAYYVPIRQHPVSAASLLIRTAGDPRVALSTLTDVARSLDRDLPLFKVQTLDETIRHSVNLQRAVAALLGVFGGLTLLLAAVGIYGVAAHSVSQRTREVGIRMSLGARAADVFRMVVRESLSLSIIGVAIGLGISAAVSRVLTAFLFGLTPTDTLTFIGGSAILCLVAVVASYVPAHRAAHMDPLVALRHD
ncbi:MAG TPA: ABC transporter permease [Vicinamibacterales bacterium]|nr:ABC transporter permease [Vicinamibacterales bacterium]